MENQNIPFTEDQVHRLINNLSIDNHNFELQSKRYVQDMNDAMNLLGMFNDIFTERYNHNSYVRRVCDNPDCKSVYAYFYEDWHYCPKCGTKLRTTRDERTDHVMPEIRKDFFENMNEDNFANWISAYYGPPGKMVNSDDFVRNHDAWKQWMFDVKKTKIQMEKKEL